ncbi:MAG TPA: ATP-binding protein [Chthonomonadaceae bacterium]|nr:ATP-binding protein [Chthonomonadaceae bacterium]
MTEPSETSESQLQPQPAHLRRENTRLTAAQERQNTAQQVEAEDKTQATVIRITALLENLQTGILIEDENRIILQANSMFCKLFRLSQTPEELVGVDCAQTAKSEKVLFAEPERFLQRMAQILEERQPVSNEELLLVDGRTLERDYTPIFLGPNYLGHLWQYRDITERKRLEEEVRRTQKIEGLNRMARGIAHDYNNLLTAIQGYTGLARLEVEPDTDLALYLSNIQKAAERAANLTHQLLAFARRQEAAPVEANLNHFLLETDRLLRPLCGAHIELVTLPGAGLSKVRLDQGQFDQVLINLVMNACDAMPNGGKIVIETRMVTLDAEYARTHVAVTPGRYVLLSVSDTGRGMTDEVKAHLFDPFFTTKRMGQGAGLGLATCYGIVRQSGGHIQVYSEPDRGTVFKIYFPSVEPMPPQDSASAPALTGGTETVLLVEDEPMVRDIAAQALRGQGYTVLEASDGEVALRVANTHPGDIHLLMTDMVMPQMGGKELAERLRASRPQITVLYTSGYTDVSLVHQGALAPGMDFLHKPFTASALIYKVRTVLDAALAPR